MKVIHIVERERWLPHAVCKKESLFEFFGSKKRAKAYYEKLKEELITKSEICEWKIIFPSSTKPTSEFFDVRSNDEEEGERICLYTREVK